MKILVAVAEPGCVHRGGQGGASNQAWGGTEIYIFQYKNVVDNKLLDYLVLKTQLNTINYYLIVIETFVNYYIK